MIRSHHVVKALSFPVGSDDRLYHMYLGKVTGEQLEHGLLFACKIRIRGRLAILAAPAAWMTYLLAKHQEKYHLSDRLPRLPP